MRLTVLGRYGPFPAAGGACSGYLLTHGGTRVLLECGAGVFSRLTGVCGPETIDAAVLTHLHFDHCGDMPILRYALESLSARGRARLPLAVYAPDAPATGFALLASPSFSLRTLFDGASFSIGALRFTAHAVRHPVPAFAFTVRAPGGPTLFYTGDTAYFDGLAALSRGADTILADACHLDADDTGRALNHMTARQAGRLAKEAGAKRLLLTHVWGGGHADDAMRQEADFPMACVVREGGEYDMTPHKGDDKHAKENH